MNADRPFSLRPARDLGFSTPLVTLPLGVGRLLVYPADGESHGLTETLLLVSSSGRARFSSHLERQIDLLVGVFIGKETVEQQANGVAKNWWAKC